MKKYIAFTIVTATLAAWTGCTESFAAMSGAWSDADLQAGTNRLETAEIPADLKNLHVENSMGSIHITGTETGPARWTWKLVVNARTDAIAQQIARGITCKTETEGGHLKLVVSLPNTKEPHRVQSDFEITVPKSAAVWTQTSFGKTDISNLASDVEAADQNGRMEIHKIGGQVRARTSFEGLAVSDSGPATLHNQNGEIWASHIAGPLEAETSFASLVAEDIRGSALLANQNGEIKAASIGSFLDAKTSFGAIVARDIGGYVHLRDQNGSVNLRQAKGDAMVKTSFDRLSVEGIQGDAILMNQNGAVAAKGVTGSVKANTSFAAMVIEGAGSKFDCQNQNGAIRLHATSDTLKEIEANTSFDTLELRLPAGVQPAILAHTSFGEVKSDFPVLAKAQGDDAFADVAPGTLRATLRNQNGNIRVLRD